MVFLAPVAPYLLAVLILGLPADEAAPFWRRHVIDNSSRGADGVRLADVDRDGHVDIATGWEQGGVVRVCLNPGPSKVRERWPAVTVGKAPAVEDAVFVDLDADGAVDLVSSCEGKTRSIYIHWAPAGTENYLKESAWKTEALPASAGKMQWMFCVPLQVDGRYGIDLVAAGKNQGGAVGWFEAPAEARQLDGWKWHPLREAGWIMSLVASDMDADGDLDILASDRRGPGRGCFWLENPGAENAVSTTWRSHTIGATGLEVMFLVQADLDRDGLLDVLVAVRPRTILWLRRTSGDGRGWESLSIDFPVGFGDAKAVRAGDVDLDGKLDLVFSCERAEGDLSGVGWLRYRESPRDRRWEHLSISGPRGVKYDRLELLDLDLDGDLDVLTTEENENLGVVWYENPRR